jgi:hypothetical protein
MARLGRFAIAVNVSEALTFNRALRILVCFVGALSALWSRAQSF